jgi:hypothetical protein
LTARSDPLSGLATNPRSSEVRVLHEQLAGAHYDSRWIFSILEWVVTENESQKFEECSVKKPSTDGHIRERKSLALTTFAARIGQLSVELIVDTQGKFQETTNNGESREE